MESLGHINLWLFILAILWTLPWKGYSLWTAAKRDDKRWFIALVVLNTFGLLDIYYTFYVAKKSPKDILHALKKKV